MKNEQEIKDLENSDEKPVENAEEGAPVAEFKVTVRKLEVPVRPRGVLAE